MFDATSNSKSSAMQFNVYLFIIFYGFALVALQDTDKMHLRYIVPGELWGRWCATAFTHCIEARADIV